MVSPCFSLPYQHGGLALVTNAHIHFFGGERWLGGTRGCVRQRGVGRTGHTSKNACSCMLRVLPCRGTLSYLKERCRLEVETCVIKYE